VPNTDFFTTLAVEFDHRPIFSDAENEGVPEVGDAGFDRAAIILPRNIRVTSENVTVFSSDYAEGASHPTALLVEEFGIEAIPGPSVNEVSPLVLTNQAEDLGLSPGA